ncbi:type I-E CRISPR-associated protein Cse1/CasA [Streptomyces sp. NPDC004435]|uniref:type I-E CRISPR-associated protein Cse1/CasA n=1 Tax=Streptomyces sp. NPDC004435 TaxID=3364701 RepID=UPI0036BB0F39
MTGGRQELDLLTHPWISVMDLRSGEAREVGLIELFDRAEELHLAHSGLEGVVVFRLIAALYDAAAGPTTTAQWDRAWTAPALDTAPILAYFEQWQDRFDVFHPEYPFLQCAAVTRPTQSVGVLNISRYGRGGGFFDGRLARGVDEHPPMTPVHAFLAALVMLGYDVAGMKTPHPDDPRGKAGNRVGMLAQVTHAHFTISGTVKDMLLLSLPPAPRTPGDTPAWERPSPGPAHAARPITGRLDLLTWPSRRVRLFPGPDGAVRKVGFYPGDRSVQRTWDEIAEIDPMTAWIRQQKPGRSMKPGKLFPVSVVASHGSERVGAAAKLLTNFGHCAALDHVLAACERGVLLPEQVVTATLAHVTHTDPKKSLLQGVHVQHAPLGVAGELARVEERAVLDKMASGVARVRSELAELHARVTGRPHAPALLRDLSGEWAEVVLTEDRAGALVDLREALLVEIDDVLMARNSLLNHEQRARVEAERRRLRGLVRDALDQRVPEVVGTQ